MLAGTGSGIRADAVSISNDTTAADNLETMLDGTGGQNLTLARLVADNSAGSGPGIYAKGGDSEAGMELVGTGSGAGLRTSGGATGNGVIVNGGGSSYGMAINSASGGLAALALIGTGAEPGLSILAGPTGHGVLVTAGSTSGDGIRAEVTSGAPFRGDMTGNVTGNLSGSVGSVTGLTIPTVAQIADGVWDEAIAGHLTGGTTGAALNGAGSAGDPWTTTLPGAYGAGTAGKIVGDNLNATVGSRSSHSAADVWAVVTRVLTAGTNIVLAKGTGVTGFNDLDAAGVRGAVGLAAANLDTQLGNTYARIGAPAGASMAADVAGLLTEVQKVPRLGTTYRHTNPDTLATADVTIEAAV